MPGFAAPLILRGLGLAEGQVRGADLEDERPHWEGWSASWQSVEVLHPHTPAEYLDRNEAQFELNWLQAGGWAGSAARRGQGAGQLVRSGADRALNGGRG